MRLPPSNGGQTGEELDVAIDPVMTADNPEMLIPTLLAGGGLILSNDFAMRPYQAGGAGARRLEGIGRRL